MAALPWWSRATGVLHYVFAVVLFSMFAVFALWLFRVRPVGEDKIPTGKRKRNRLYFICGLVIVASMIWAGVAGLRKQPIFWPETVALIAFAVSWLAKGFADKRIANAVRLFRGKGEMQKVPTG